MRKEIFMKLRILIATISICILFIANYNEGHGGFQDFLKDAKKFFGQEEGLTENEIINGLKEALKIGTSNAVGTVSKFDGYYKNPDIKIPLPDDVLGRGFIQHGVIVESCQRVRVVGSPAPGEPASPTSSPTRANARVAIHAAALPQPRGNSHLAPLVAQRVPQPRPVEAASLPSTQTRCSLGRSSRAATDQTPEKRRHGRDPARLWDAHRAQLVLQSAEYNHPHNSNITI